MAQAQFKHTLYYNGIEKELTIAPAGWEDITTTYKRNKLYDGVFLFDELGLRFTKQGAKDSSAYQFILDAKSDGGIKAKVTYKREVYNNFTGAYDLDYTGILDLTPKGYSHNRSDQYIEVAIIESSKTQSLFANQDKNVRLGSTEALNGNPITPFVNAPFKGVYPEIDIYLYALTTGDLNIVRPFTGNLVIQFPYNYVASEDYIGERLQAYPNVKIWENSTDEAINIEFTIKGTYSGTFTFTPNGTPNSGQMTEFTRIEIYDVDDNLLQRYSYFTENDGHNDIATPQTYNFNGTIDDYQEYLVPVDGYIIFINECQATTMSNMVVSVDTQVDITQFDISEVYDGEPDSHVDTYYTLETANRLAQIMTGEQDTSKLIHANVFGRTDSEYETYPVDGRLARIGTIGGKVLRDLANSDTIINFKDWFLSVKNMGGIAMWYEKNNDRLRIEDTAEAYKKEVMFDLGVVSDLIESPAPEQYYSKLLTGTREKGDYEKLQGVLEYNVTSEHAIDMPVSDSKDFRVVYNTDSIGCEFQRRLTRNLFKLIDTKEDDKTYMFEFDSSGKVITFDDVGGFDGFIGLGERYNPNFTPRQCLLNQANKIAGMFFENPDDTIRFITNSKDINIFVNGHYEQDEITVAEMGESLCLPNLLSFNATVTQSDINELNSDPSRMVKFSDNIGNVYYGFIHMAEIKRNNNISKFELIQANYG